MKTPIESSRSARLQAVHEQALGLMEQLGALAAGEPKERLPWLHALIDQLQEVAEFAAGGTVAPAKRPPAFARRQLQKFGQLLRDKRDAAGLSRSRLARQARLSDATIKLLERAHHPPSQTTLAKLIGVAELRLSWEDTPGICRSPEAPVLAMSSSGSF